MWTIWRAPTNASKWRMGFDSAFKGLRQHCVSCWTTYILQDDTRTLQCQVNVSLYKYAFRYTTTTINYMSSGHYDMLLIFFCKSLQAYHCKL